MQTNTNGGSTGAFPFLLGNVLLGTIGIFVYYANAAPLTTTWFRCAFGLVGLTVWVLVRRQTGALRLNRTTGPWILLAGALLVVSWVLFFSAIERTSTGMTVVLFQVQPMWILVLGAWWLKEPVGRRRMVSAGLAMVGLVLATGLVEPALWLDGGEQRASGYGLGVAWCLIGAFFTACVTIIAKRLHEIPPGVLAWWQCAIGTLTLWIWPMQHGWSVPAASWPWLAGLGFVHTGLAYTLMYAGMPRLSAARIAVFQFVYPGVAIVIDWLYFGQRMGVVQLSGIALMSVAIWYAERASTPTAARVGG